ncbi:MAG: phosphocholine cytidylyltransferase family protein [Lachnospiraceae bacterium]|nr:phosphocholine cytidylyltransferase family protein [Lachnospiraceae bacterium]
MATAILMAAGCGTRISRKINDCCKCTLDIGGVSLIRYTVQMLINNNIDVHIVVGYDAERVIGELEGLQVTFHRNHFYSITNSLVSLWFAKEAISDDVVILGNADVYWEEMLLHKLLAEERNNVMLCDSSRVEIGDYLFRTENGKVVAFGKGNNCSGANCEYVGLAAIRGNMIPKFKKRLEELVENQHHNFWWEQVLYSMTEEQPIWAEDIAGTFWAEIDYIEDYGRILEYRKNVQ